MSRQRRVEALREVLEDVVKVAEGLKALGDLDAATAAAQARRTEAEMALAAERGTLNSVLGELDRAGDAVAQRKAEGEQIIADAKVAAAEILAVARSDGERLIDQAKENATREAQRIESRGEQAGQAARVARDAAVRATEDAQAKLDHLSAEIASTTAELAALHQKLGSAREAAARILGV